MAGGPASEKTSPIHDYPRNVVLFGQTGVGKSSIINLIAGEELAKTSNDALGCTVQAQEYNVILPLSDEESGSTSITVRFWDTAGLEEGTQGAVPAIMSNAHLKSLLQTLARSTEGIHLLLFCIRGTSRLTRELRRQYDHVYTSLCREKVRIALVVTGLEHQYLDRAAGMEMWWKENEGRVGELGMQFDKHVCVATGSALEGIGQKRRLESRILLRELVSEFTRPGQSPWKWEPWWPVKIVLVFLRLRGAPWWEWIKASFLNLYKICATLMPSRAGQ